MDYVENLLKKFNVPVTRANYLGLAYPDGLPEDWGAEHEAELPISIRDKNADISLEDQFKMQKVEE